MPNKQKPAYTEAKWRTNQNDQWVGSFDDSETFGRAQAHLLQRTHIAEHAFPQSLQVSIDTPTQKQHFLELLIGTQGNEIAHKNTLNDVLYNTRNEPHGAIVEALDQFKASNNGSEKISKFDIELLAHEIAQNHTSSVSLELIKQKTIEREPDYQERRGEERRQWAIVARDEQLLREGKPSHIKRLAEEKSGRGEAEQMNLLNDGGSASTPPAITDHSR